MRNTVFLNDNWEYFDRYDERLLLGEGDNFIKVSLPHCVTETPFHYFDEKIYQKTVLYRRTLRKKQEWQNKRIFLCIDAAAHFAKVFVNAEKIAEHKGGYTAFEAELTDKLREDRDSVVSIKVDSHETLNFPPFGKVIDYMTYGGLYRGVRLDIREESFIKDVFCVPTVPDGIALPQNADEKTVSDIRFTGTLRCHTEVEKGDGCAVHYSLYEYGGDHQLKESDEDTFSIDNIRLWDVLSPTLYTLRTELIKDGKVLDRMDTAIGFRKSQFAKNGYFLNGRRLKIVGLNRHQSFPYVGYAMPKSIQRYDAEILKNELGLNAVRTSHYPQSRHFVTRCDELGLLVFTEIPGWQHIGDDEWKKSAIAMTAEMVKQYRNHPSVILWGVRINESRDDDELYRLTNAVAHSLDESRPTGGVRYLKKSSFLEDVYTYNDFSHSGKNAGCEPKKQITPDPEKPYLISEYNGHMYPTKSFDNEELRTEHMLRHARVLDSAASYNDIAGSFGWCYADYNTHRDFGSGDRICYHGVCDMFRNPKLAAAVYAVRQDQIPVLELSSSMDIGEHPASVRGRIYLLTNADRVRMYKNDAFIREYTHQDSDFSHLYRPPIEIADLIGDRIKEGESFSEKQADAVKELLNFAARFGMDHLTPALKAKAAHLMVRHKMTFEDAYRLYGKYIENWGDAASFYRFEAIKGNKVVKTVIKEPFETLRLRASVSSDTLHIKESADVAAIRIKAVDQNENILPFFFGAVRAQVTGAAALIGPDIFPLYGGMGGTYLRTTGETGKAVLTLRTDGAEELSLRFDITE